MAALETLILQLFERKRQIIDQLNHQKLLYDQNLASKLLIQGISPPPWLTSNLPPPSRIYAFEKSDLISDILHPRPVPVATCPVSCGVLYDKPVSVVKDGVPNEACGGKYPSNTSCDEDGSSVIPLHNVDDTEDSTGVATPFHTEVKACTLNYGPVSPEEQSHARTCNTQPNPEQSVVNYSVPNEACGGKYPSNTSCDEDCLSVIPLHNVADTEDSTGIVAPFHTEVNASTLNYCPMSPEEQSYARSCDTQPKPEQSLVKMERSRSRQRALEIRKSAKTSGKSRLGSTNNVDAPSQNTSCQRDEKFYGPRESSDLVRSLSLSPKHKEEASIENKSPNASGGFLSQFANNEVKKVITGDNPKKEKNSGICVGRVTRCSSHRRQSDSVSFGSKAPQYVAQVDGSALPTEISSCEEEIRNCFVKRSDDALDVFPLRDLLINNIDGGDSANKVFQGAEEVNGLRDLVEPPVKVKSPDSCHDLVTLTSNNMAEDVHGSDMPEMSDSIYAGRLTRSRSYGQQSVGVLSRSKRRDNSVQPHGSRGHLESRKSFVLPVKICSREEPGIGPCSTERSNDAYNVTSSKDLGINNNVGVLSGNNNSQADEQHNAQSDSLGLIKRLSFLAETCDKEEASIKLTKLTSRCQLFMDVSSSSNTHGSSKQLDGLREFLGSYTFFALPSEICDREEAYVGPCLIQGSCDGSDISLTKSVCSKGKDGELRNDWDKRSSSFTAGKVTTSTSGSIEGVDDSREILGSYSLSALPSETCDREKACGGIKESFDASDISETRDREKACVGIKESFDAIDISLTESGNSKAKEEEPRYDGDKKSSSFTAGKTMTSSSSSQSSVSISSSNKRSGHGENINDCRESMESAKQTLSSNEETKSGDTNSGMLHQEEWGSSVMLTMTSGENQIPASSLSIDCQSIILEPSDCYTKELVVKIEHGSSEQCGGRIDVMVEGEQVSNSTETLLASNKANNCEELLQVMKKLKYSITSPVVEHIDKANREMCEFQTLGVQNFADKFLHEEVPAPSNIMEYLSLHERIRPVCFSTPGSPFPAACKSSVPFEVSKNNNFRSSLHEQQCNTACLSTPSSPYPDAYNVCLEPGIYSSVPNGLLENIDLRNNLFSVGSGLQQKSQSDLFSFPFNQSQIDFMKPFLSPVEKGLGSITSKSGGSDKVNSGNPELTCFTILEDPESSEEDDTEAKTNLEESGLSYKRSSIRDPLCDITVKNRISLVTDHAVEKRSLESVNTAVGVAVEKKSLNSLSTEIGVPGEKRTVKCASTDVGVTVEEKSVESGSAEIEAFEVCDMDGQPNGMAHRQSTRSVRGKENTGFSVGGDNSKKNTKGLSCRFSKPKLSGRASLRIRGQSMSEKEPKRNNIVSNLKSFIPLVQQKHAAATAPVKRDVKVKALEAAEATKRLAEKKENERKQRKEALKIERARLEQENLKQMELAKQLKEEAKKKREAENAAKKRQREEEDKKQKNRKRKRVEDARCQQKQAHEKIQAWRKDLRYGAEEQRTFEAKELNNRAPKEFDRINEASITTEPVNELVDSGITITKASDDISPLSDNILTEPSLIGKVPSVVTAETLTPNIDKTNKPISQNTKEQSYDISPYQCSDDEEEEDEMPNKKFIPSWASKSCVLLALSSSKHLDPDTIFPPGRFCSLDEVLLPRRPPQDSRK